MLALENPAYDFLPECVRVELHVCLYAQLSSFDIKINTISIYIYICINKDTICYDRYDLIGT